MDTAKANGETVEVEVAGKPARISLGPSEADSNRAAGLYDLQIWGNYSMWSDGNDLNIQGLTPAQAREMIDKIIATLAAMRDDLPADKGGEVDDLAAEYLRLAGA